MAQHYTVDCKSLAKSFPKTMPVPPLLLAFAKWLKNVPYRGVGTFDCLMGEPLRESFLKPPPTAEMCSKLGIFVYLPDGSRLALWDHGGKQPAVVLLGSEGELETIAPDLPAFLAALSKAKTGVNDLDQDDEDAPKSTAKSHRAALAAWLKATPLAKRQKHAKAPDFDVWYEAKLAGREVEKTEPPLVTAPPLAMDEFCAKTMSLMGHTARDTDLQTFLAALKLWPLPRWKDVWDLYVEDKPRGFCLVFSEAENLSVGRSRVPKLSGCFLYSKGKDGYRAFLHPMPKGITWTDSAASLHAKLGKPGYEYRDKKSGALTGHRWQDRDPAKPYLAVGYVKDGTAIDDVYIGI
jgi:hypothetical protein